MFKLFNFFLTKRLLNGNKKQTIFNSSFLVFNSLKLKSLQSVSLNFFSFSILISFLLFSASCNTTEPPPPDEQPNAIKLKLIDVSCTEAFINITASDTVLPVNITLKKDDINLFSFMLTQTDTTVIDTTLQPDLTYTYQTTAQIKGVEQKSDTLQVKTLNTTSHNFTWQTFTFGEPTAGSSTLYDVTIIDENNIWAVGEIYMNDSLGNPDPDAYNAVHWNGINWELKRIYYYGVCSAVMYPPLMAVWAFNENNIVITNGGSIGWFDGTTVDLDCGVNPLLSGAINKIWGMSNNDLYVVGNGGSIAHYQNGSWSKIESGTTSDIKDIWGNIDPVTQSYKILAVAFSPGETRIFTINSNSAIDTLNWPVNKGLGSIWFDKFHLFVSGSGVWKNKNNVWEKMNGVPDYFLNTIRGDKINNLFAVGWTVRMVHYNGVEWKEIPGIPEEFNFESVAVKEKKVIAVGFSSSGGLVGKAVIFIGAQIK